jgi:hypothetical protein
MDISTLALTDHRTDAMVMENFLEFQHRFMIRPLQADPWMGVERDDVHLAGNILHQLYQPLSILCRIVYAPDQVVFKGNPLSGRERITGAGLEEFVQRIFFIYRHEVASRLVIAGIEGNSQVDRQFPAQPLHLRNETGSREGDSAVRKMKTPRA